MTNLIAQVPCVLLADKSGAEIATWAAIVAIVFMTTIGKIRAKQFHECRSDAAAPRKCGRSWKWLGGTLLVVLLIGLFVKVATFEDQVFDHREQVAAVVSTGPQASTDITLKKWPIHQAYEELNRSRIKLPPEAVSVAPGNATVHPQSAPVDARSLHEEYKQRIRQIHDERAGRRIDLQVDGSATESPSDPQEQSASIARSIERIERAAEQVSSAAEQVTNIGTIVGRAMVLLNNSLGSSAATVVKSGPKPVPVDSAVDTVEPQIEINVETTTPKNDVPAWIDDPSKRVGNSWREVIQSGEYATVEECYRAADVYLLLATYEHLQQLTGATGQFAERRRPSLTFQYDNVLADGRLLASGSDIYDDRLRGLSRMGIGIDFVRREITKDEFVETTERSFGPMKNLYTQIEFTPSIDAELKRRWSDYRREDRFELVGIGALSVLSLIGLAWGLIQVDTWTKGYYTKRLFFGVPAAIIGIFVLLIAAS